MLLLLGALACIALLAVNAWCAVQAVRLLRQPLKRIESLAAPVMLEASLQSIDDAPREYVTTVAWLGGRQAPTPTPPAGSGWRLDAATLDGRQNLLLFWSRGATVPAEAAAPS